MNKLKANTLFSTLETQVPWRTEIDSYGPQDRRTYYCGDDDAVFHYVGLTLAPRAWPYVLHVLRRKIETEIMPLVNDRLLAQVPAKEGPSALPSDGCSGASLAGCLLNYYQAGMGFIPWHSDEVRAHGALKVVATVSLGGARPFILRRKRPVAKEAEEDALVPLEVLLEPGSVLVMAGATQEFFEHTLPLHGPRSPARISLTFRSIVPGFETPPPLLPSQ